jgi:hypothetical protein
MTSTVVTVNNSKPCHYDVVFGTVDRTVKFRPAVGIRFMGCWGTGGGPENHVVPDDDYFVWLSHLALSNGCSTRFDGNRDRGAIT